MVRFLKEAGHLDSLRLKSPKELEISPQDLARLRENMLHPETRVAIDHHQNYLNKTELAQISPAYGEGHRTRILGLMDEYQKIMMSDRYSPTQKLDIMNDTRIFMQRFIDTAKDKGFGMHVMKKLHFDMQQRLQALMPHDLKPANIDAAFSAALKLDRVELFNKVVSSAIKNNKLDSAEFHNFLQTCIDQSALARNHQDASTASQEIERTGVIALRVLRLPRLVVAEVAAPEVRVEVVPEIRVVAVDVDELDAIDPTERRVAELHRQQEDLAIFVPPAAVVREEDVMAQRTVPDSVELRT